MHIHTAMLTFRRDEEAHMGMWIPLIEGQTSHIQRRHMTKELDIESPSTIKEYGFDQCSSLFAGVDGEKTICICNRSVLEHLASDCKLVNVLHSSPFRASAAYLAMAFCLSEPPRRHCSTCTCFRHARVIQHRLCKPKCHCLKISCLLSRIRALCHAEL